ncbi:MAG: methyltransferase domain-containing protein [Chloroflexi bacterium]|nr:methyltransferase domain-containing protein [Chloroflexota bacterium]MBU1661406.1 methyltransferase domain-containing protein [Chloroflexota bacterium]
MERDFRQYVLHHYNRAANYYDIIEFIRKGTRPKVIEMSGWQPSEKVLDVCTGTGDLALAFARLGAEVIGIDIAENMLQRAAAKSNGEYITWLKMDATDLQFPANSFDVTTLSLALHHMPENTQHQVLSEIARVTRRKVVLVEPHQPFAQWMHSIWGFVASFVDKSEYMPQWVHQDFNQTCYKAGLKVDEIRVSTLAIHRLTACNPMDVRHET